MKFKKKRIAIVMLFAMLINLMPLNAWAEDVISPMQALTTLCQEIDSAIKANVPSDDSTTVPVGKLYTSVSIHNKLLTEFTSGSAVLTAMPVKTDAEILAVAATLKSELELFKQGQQLKKDEVTLKVEKLHADMALLKSKLENARQYHSVEESFNTDLCIRLSDYNYLLKRFTDLEKNEAERVSTGYPLDNNLEKITALLQEFDLYAKPGLKIRATSTDKAKITPLMDELTELIKDLEVGSSYQIDKGKKGISSYYYNKAQEALELAGMEFYSDEASTVSVQKEIDRLNKCIQSVKGNTFMGEKKEPIVIVHSAEMLELGKKIDQAVSVFDGVNLSVDGKDIYLDEKWVTKDSKEAFHQVIFKAETLRDTYPEKPKEEFLEMSKQLLTASEVYTKSEKAGTKPLMAWDVNSLYINEFTPKSVKFNFTTTAPMSMGRAAIKRASDSELTAEEIKRMSNGSMPYEPYESDIYLDSSWPNSEANRLKASTDYVVYAKLDNVSAEIFKFPFRTLDEKTPVIDHYKREFKLTSFDKAECSFEADKAYKGKLAVISKSVLKNIKPAELKQYVLAHGIYIENKANEPLKLTLDSLKNNEYAYAYVVLESTENSEIKSDAMKIGYAFQYKNKSDYDNTPTDNSNTTPVNPDGSKPYKESSATKDSKKDTTVTVDTVNNVMIPSGKPTSPIIPEVPTTPTLGTNTVEVKPDTSAGNATVKLPAKFDSIVKAVKLSAYDSTYELPVSLVTPEKIALASGIALDKIKNVETKLVAKPASLELTEKANKFLADNKAKLRTDIISYEIEAQITTSDNQVIKVVYEKFDTFVVREFEIKNPNTASTYVGVVFDEKTGAFRPVPTSLETRNGKYYARVNSLTNSSYGVISIDNIGKLDNRHWASDLINEFGAKMIIEEPSKFNPDKLITRGEFATLLMRSMGVDLTKVEVDAKFKDLTSADSNAKAILMASKMGILSGTTNGLVKPNDAITRQEMAVMLSNAGKYLAYKDAVASRVNQKDVKQVAPWAKDMLKMVEYGIFTGYSDGMLAPNKNITNAEALQVVKNALVNAGVMN